MAQLVLPEGFVVVLNPSELMSIAAATDLANQRSLQGLDRESLLNWAATGESNQRWGGTELQKLFDQTGNADTYNAPGWSWFGSLPKGNSYLNSFSR